MLNLEIFIEFWIDQGRCHIFRKSLGTVRGYNFE